MTEPNRRLSRRQALGIFGGAAATGFLAACGAASPSPSATQAATTAGGDPLAGLGLPSYYPASYKDIIEAAKKEPKLQIYSIMSKPTWPPALQDFTTKPPLI